MTKMSSFCSNAEITKIYVVEPQGNIGNLTADTLTVRGDLFVEGNFYNCNTGNTVSFFNTLSACTDDTINLGANLVPTVDSTWNLGTAYRRFRNVNTVSGTSTIWTATDVVYTPVLNLGLDLSGETRIITADNSVIQYDILAGGSY